MKRGLLMLVVGTWLLSGLAVANRQDVDVVLPISPDIWGKNAHTQAAVQPCNRCCIYQDQNYSEGAVLKNRRRDVAMRARSQRGEHSSLNLGTPEKVTMSLISGIVGQKRNRHSLITPAVAGSEYHSANSAQTGAWSEGFSILRIW